MADSDKNEGSGEVKLTLSQKLKVLGRVVKKGLTAALVVSAISTIPLAAANYWKKWVYQVKTNYGVVVTSSSGDRIAVTNPGWYSRIPFVTTYEGLYPLANQMVMLYGNSNPNILSTGDGLPVLTSATTFYSITDLRKYAIGNMKEDVDKDEELTRMVISPKTMLQKSLDSLVSGFIQKTPADKLIHERPTIEKEIFNTLKDSDLEERFGITINSFNITYANYLDAILSAMANNQANLLNAETNNEVAMKKKLELTLIAEGNRDATIINKEAMGKLAEADIEYYKKLVEEIRPKTPEERRLLLETFNNMIKYRTLKERKGDTVWVLPESTSPVITPKSPSTP